MSDQQLNNLIKMLDQIIANNLHYGDDDKVTDVAADHLHKFWARSMKQLIIAHADQSPEELSGLARSTVIKLKTHINR
ncbi:MULTISPECIES: formate dehydrogenase subunit delta [Marinobacter]|uniref:Formate dehydrogenase subunit delta n=1 Tax=Marinobacter xiaoshiensis TaxID=3073652 RepID=A0ABU2HDT3_9GAMM|nr:MULTISPECIES: formate dehydrogenase subunit delta [unclassified Marinobacter]MBK1887310.1 formate dehydrogenase subunit delta [Marinobacter sp. DY40_1A1]MDS1308893.1 formate dehydrogenase subunit delta [Marinobacter sp. F60267]